MEQIKDTLAAVIGRLKKGGKTEDEEARIFQAFRKVLTKREQSHIKCILVRDKTLTVNVDSSAWLYQFSNKKRQLAAKSGIESINFRIGEIK